MWPPLGLWAAHGGRGAAHGAWQQAGSERARAAGDTLAALVALNASTH